ncbi:glycosyl hydrolase family 95 catalytic domain-containing protein [Akkermansia massiliensis]
MWNPELRAAWMGCYFLNINSQMNQWPSLCHRPGGIPAALS